MPKISGLTLALQRIPQAAYLYAVLAVAVIGVWQANNYHQREIGKRDLLIAQHERTNADLRHQADSLAKQYRVDTVRFRVIRTQVDTLTRTVENWKTDTLKVVEYVTKADSTIRVCSLALQTCEQRVAVAQRGWDGARAEIVLLKKAHPSRARPWIYGGIGIGVGYLAGRIR